MPAAMTQHTVCCHAGTAYLHCLVGQAAPGDSLRQSMKRAAAAAAELNCILHAEGFCHDSIPNQELQ